MTQPGDARLSQLSTAVTNVEQLAVQVREGRVTIDPAVGATLLTALRTHADEIGGWQRAIGTLGNSLPLGNNHVSRAMGDKFLGRANGQRPKGSATALDVVLAIYHEAVADAIDAVEEAFRRHADNDESIRRSLHGISAV